MEDLIIYEKPTCSKCRAAIAFVDASGRPFRRVRYHEERLTMEKLRELLAKLHMTPRELVRTTEPLYKELTVKEMTDEEVLETLAEYPDLIQRPILECGNEAVLGRPTENVSAFLKRLAQEDE